MKKIVNENKREEYEKAIKIAKRITEMLDSMEQELKRMIGIDPKGTKND